VDVGLVFHGRYNFRQKGSGAHVSEAAEHRL
jgi:hypothetical protein